MIIIEKPVLKIIDGEVLCSFRFEYEGVTRDLWYKLPAKFKKFIVTENLDTALVGLLFLGLKTGTDIKLNGPVSARLYYTLKHYLINALCLANPSFKSLDIYADSFSNKNLNLTGEAATGLSCGIDSFATYFDHEKEIESFRIKYFTFFNVGSNGDFGGENAKKLFKKRARRVKEFAEMERIELINVDSNLSEILKLNFQETHTMRSISCVLLLQKLFKYYYYASSLRFDRFKLDQKRIAEYDLLSLQMLSTESTILFSSVSQMTRIERIQFIANKPETYNYLDVCTHAFNTFYKVNCSRCPKCIRTMLTLDILGFLDKYDKVFDVSHFKRNRSQYLGKLLFMDNKETLDFELIQFIKKRNIKIPLWSYLFGMKQVLIRRSHSVTNKFRGLWS